MFMALQANSFNFAPLKERVMKKDGPIIIIEDDEDDKLIFGEVLKTINLPNEILFINDSTKAIPFLKQEHINPFIVISDINMPKMNGFELCDAIRKDPYLTKKTKPFIFFTTVGNGYTIEEAFKRDVQGYFHKTPDFKQLTETLKEVITFWQNIDEPETYGTELSF